MMADLAEKVSDAELRVLEVLWQSDVPLPVTAIRTKLETEQGWGASTVKTLLRRLCEKGVIAAEKREVFYYRPLLSREVYRRRSSQSLLDRVFCGSARDLIARLVEADRLSAEDLGELWQMLHTKEEK